MGIFDLYMTYLYSFNLQKKQIPTTNQRISFSINLKISEKTLTKRSLIGSKKKTTKLLKDMVIGAASSKLFELITVFQSMENDEANRIWAFHSASGIFR